MAKAKNNGIPTAKEENNKREVKKIIEYPEYLKKGLIRFEDLANVAKKKEFLKIIDQKSSGKKILNNLEYLMELEQLQVELVKLQQWVQDNNQRVAIIFEGRDAAGKGGTIRRFIEHMNPRAMRIVALPKPTEEEKGQWYFQRYIKQLPNKGEIVFFDRSWYNRAVVEPVNKFCTNKEYDLYMRQVPEFEHMLYEDGVILIKFWFSISKEEQLQRFESRKHNPLKQWKISPVDMKAQDLWDRYTLFKERMFAMTHTSFSPWIIVKANKKKVARLNAIKYVLSQIPYNNRKNKIRFYPDPNVVSRYHRKNKMID